MLLDGTVSHLTMPSQLPPEIIHRILSYPGVCTVSDRVFVDTSFDSNQETHDRLLGTSFLLVCKTWLQVGTPLVYETVILGSPRHSRALLATLQRDPSLGLLVRKLRLHGRLGSVIEPIIQACPRITDLYLSLRALRKNNIDSFRAILPLVRPLRVIIQDPYKSVITNGPIGRAYDSIHDCIITKWLTLVSTYSIDATQSLTLS
jgi:hypothetical protein